MSAESRPTHFHLMAKPSGSICNLDCSYCFYLEKKELYPRGHRFQMGDEVLEAFTKQYIEGQDASTVNFAWQGGEPLLMGLDFFRKAVALQRKHANGKRITNALQTNGTLLNDEWCAFLADEKFLVGISIDGPRELHDRYRVDRRGKPTFDAVMKGLELLKDHRVDFNTLTVLSRANVEEPSRVYRFLKEIGSTHHQYIPLVERLPDPTTDDPRLWLAGPPALRESAGENIRMTEWSVDGPSYGRFMMTVFDEWVRHDVGRIFVRLFDEALSAFYTGRTDLCIFNETCGTNLIVEHDGAVYPCDHFMYPDLELGKLLERPLTEMVQSPEQQQFGNDKRDTLPTQCQQCEVRFACNGGCPKHRFLVTPEGEPGLNYLCGGYRPFFNHVAPQMRMMCDLLDRQQPPALVMEAIREQSPPAPSRRAGSPHSAAPVSRTQPVSLSTKVGRNDPCPCGSGKKYKRCCGAPPSGKPS